MSTKRVVPGRPKAIVEIWFREGNLNQELQELMSQATSNRIKIIRKGQKSLDAEVASHQGIIAFVEGSPEWYEGRDLRVMNAGLILALDCLEDPHNVGSLLRSAWNLGVKGVLSARERAAGQPPSAQKVASGAFEHVPFIEVANLASELLALKDMGFWVYGLDRSGSQSVHQVKLAPKSIIVIGSEETGMRKPILGVCDAILNIPQSAESDSFNAAVAGAIAGYEFVRQHGFPKYEIISTKKL
jgi:23S rRNA (guanosine2251-2'-O)-methyltransferase